ADYTEAIRLDPKRAPAYAGRGHAWYRKGEYAKAVEDYERALKLDPKNPLRLDTLAWVLATCPDDDVRDGERAVKLATRACELTRWQDGNCLDTLAAAYAEAGDFDKAVEYEKKALEDEEFAAANGPGARARLRLYQRKKPFREQPPEK